MMTKPRRISFVPAVFQNNALSASALRKRVAASRLAGCFLVALTLGVSPAHAFWNDIVYSSGRNLMLNGGTWYCYHASLYPVGVNYKSAGFRSYIDTQIQRADYAHLNAVRLTDFLQGTTSDPYDATVWNNIDDVMQKANEKNMKVILDLSTYRNFLKQSQGKMPYNMNDWNAFLDWVANRYKDDARLAFYSIAGEPAPPNSSESLRPTTSQLTNFYRDASNRIRSKDSKHLISSGGLLQLDWNSGIDWQAIFSQPT